MSKEEKSISEDNESQDELYKDARDLVIATQKVSTSYLQLKFGIGYARAVRFINMLEADGIIGPQKGTRIRQVLVRE